MADEARLSAVPNRAKTFRRSFPLEALEEGSSPAMVSHILNLSFMFVANSGPAWMILKTNPDFGSVWK